MTKGPDAFRTISEVALELDTPAHVLRFWESKFAQVKPVKRAGGRRYYRPADIALLRGIKEQLHEKGMTIKGVQKLLRENGVAGVMQMPPQEVEEAAPAAEVVSLHPDTPPILDDAPLPPNVRRQRPAALAKGKAPTAPKPAQDTSPTAGGSAQFNLFNDDALPLAPAPHARHALGSRALAAALNSPAARVVKNRHHLVPLIARLEEIHARMQV